jgi:hypothetical protein
MVTILRGFSMLTWLKLNVTNICVFLTIYRKKEDIIKLLIWRLRGGEDSR